MAGIDKKRLIKEVKSLLKEGLVAGARQLTTEADKHVPIAQGTLRTTADVKPGSDISVIISYGGEAADGTTVKYARKQYFASLRHFMPGGLPAPIQSLPRGPGLSGHDNIYGRSYRMALKDGILRRVPGGLQWLDRALKDVRARRRIRNAVINKFK